jgi:hypothetical protein
MNDDDDQKTKYKIFTVVHPSAAGIHLLSRHLPYPTEIYQIVYYNAIYFRHSINSKTQHFLFSSPEAVSDCCLTPTEQFFSYIMASEMNWNTPAGKTII